MLPVNRTKNPGQHISEFQRGKNNAVRSTNGTLGPLGARQDIKMNSLSSYPHNAPRHQLHQKAKHQIIKNSSLKCASSCTARDNVEFTWQVQADRLYPISVLATMGVLDAASEMV